MNLTIFNKFYYDIKFILHFVVT